VRLSTAKRKSGAILQGPVDYAGEAPGHLRLEGDCVGMDIDAVLQPEIKDRIAFWKGVEVG
jgi:hypothetical protein